MRTISWILLAVLGALVMLGSLGSAWTAYFSQEDVLGTVSISELSGGSDSEVAMAVRARRGTSAAFAAGFALLFLMITLGPYRRGEVWSWWALLSATLLVSLLILARLVFLEGTAGAFTGFLLSGVVAVALLLDIGRLKR